MHQHTSIACALACTLTPAFTRHARASVPDYALVGSFDLEGSTWNTLNDGRVISIDQSGIIRTQTNVNSSGFTTVGSIDASLLSSFGGASFISVSPDGSTIAIGDNNFGAGASVLVVQTSALDASQPTAVTSFAVGNFSAEWFDNSTIAVAGGDNASGDAVVTQLNTTNGSTQILVNDIGGASSGITIHDGFLYTGNGFQFGGPSETGEVRAFALADLASSTLSFETQGITVTDLLSAGSLDFEAEGNLLVGGGDLFGGSGDFGYVGVVDAEDVDAALLGGPAALAALELTPDPAVDFNTVRFNDFTGEVLIEAAGVIYRYQVPAPASAALALTAVTCAARRRRNA